MQDVKVKALRGFRGPVDGTLKEVKAGEVVTVSYLFAESLYASKKAEPAPAAKAKEPVEDKPERKSHAR